MAGTPIPIEQLDNDAFYEIAGNLRNINNTLEDIRDILKKLVKKTPAERRANVKQWLDESLDTSDD